MAAIRERGLASISGEFSEYTPPYIYLLNIASWIEPYVGTVPAVKLVNLPFVIVLSFGVGGLVTSLSEDPERGRIAAALMLLVPFMILFLLLAIRGRPLAAVAMFGLAFSFKQQALFLAPVLAYLILSRQMRAWHVLIIPLVYVLAMVPAAAAGRPWPELFAIYRHQSGLMHELSMNAPNPWWFARVVIDYGTGVWIGLLLGIAAAIAIVAWAIRLEPGPATTLLVALMCAAILPYVLPKMNPRYFFVAEMLSIALALAQPRMWLIAVLLQFASLLSILAYFTQTSLGPTMAFIPMTFAICLLVDTFVAARKKPLQAASPA